MKDIGVGTHDGTGESRYLRLLLRNMWHRKAEFFGGLFLSVVTGAATSWLQYREGMLDRRHVWDGVITTAIPVLGLVLLFALIEVARAATLLHWEQQEKIAKQAAELQTARATAPAAIAPCVEIAYSSRVVTFVSASDEQEYDELEEYFTFRNVGGEIVRRVTVESFLVLGEEQVVAIVPTLAPGDPPAERRVRLDRLRDANVKLKAFHKVPVGVPITVRYFGASDAPQHTARHALIYDRRTIRIEPYVGEVITAFLDASESPPDPQGD